MTSKLSIVVTLLIILAGLAMTGIGLMHVQDRVGTEYHYTVKAEQVNDAGSVSESIEYDTLTGDEKDVLYRAFKKSDHFLGGGSDATVVTDEPLNVDSDWRVVEVEGVPILVAMQGPDSEPVYEYHVDMLAMIIAGVTTLMMVFTGPSEGTDENTSRNRYH